MRKRRVIIFDDERLVLSMLRDFFWTRGYEVLSYADPTMVCPIDDGGGICAHFTPCADIVLADFHMPGLSGVELLERQHKKGCPLHSRNKAVMSPYLDPHHRRKLDEHGFHFLQKPFSMRNLSEWLSSCEQRMDLTRQLATRRREERFDSYREIVFRMPERDDTMSGIAVNISRSGFCIRVPYALKREERIRIDSGHVETCKEAAVRWVKPEGNGAYLAGLLCC